MSIKRKAIEVLRAAAPADKVAAAHEMAQQWRAGRLGVEDTGNTHAPDMPGRPEKPELVNPQDAKRRRIGSVEGRAALLHAIAHIEFNAINLAADMLARYGDSPRIADVERRAFIDDWVGVCGDEARHFTMINDRLADLDSYYGALPAHDGLWQAAIATSKDLAARLVVAPMVLEARGLDVTPSMIKKLVSVGDKESAAILGIIYEEEIPHVAAGTRWFTHICQREQLNPVETFKSLLQIYYNGTLKPPFNEGARSLAGMSPAFYQP